MVTHCNMTVAKADVTSEHWAVNIAKIKIVPKLTSGSHVSDKVIIYFSILLNAQSRNYYLNIS